MAYQNMSSEAEDEFELRDVKIHVPPTSRESRWSHIEDLDLFFTRLYNYHQKQGFWNILGYGIKDLLEVVVMVIVIVFFTYFVKYTVISGEELPANFNATHPVRLKITDIICPLYQCSNDIHSAIWICITLVLIYWMFRLIKLIYNLYHFWDIHKFFNIALQISDVELPNLTWHEVEQKILEAQKVQQMCIRKNTLNELDIYHRILRSKNYMVAMINKSILPIQYNVPLIGNISYMSEGLKYNIELLLFSETWGFFANWHLKEDYKKISKRHELAFKFERTIILFAIMNLLLSVFIFVWQLIYCIFNYAEILKREPGYLALRCWSLFGRLYLRHFNELDHELEARLRRAYRPASKYMNTFSSQKMTIVAKHVKFITGSILCIMTVLVVYHEQVLIVEHVLSIITVLGIVFAVCKGLIPDEDMFYNPETLMTEILSELHYLPDTWKGKAHTTFVRDEFAQFFQCRAVDILFELISPLTTPLILYFKLRPRSLEIVDFYRHFTVSVTGVGDVCSFSSMDVRKHGNPAWQAAGHLQCPESNKQTQAENGKTELSLIHFATMNPKWRPPEDVERYINEIKEKALNYNEINQENDKSLEALNLIASELNMLQSRLMLPQKLHHLSLIRMPTYKLEGPAVAASYYYNSPFSNFDSATQLQTDSNRQVKMIKPPSSLDMSMSVLYLHTIHHKKLLTESQLPRNEQTEKVNYPNINIFAPGTPSTAKLTDSSDTYTTAIPSASPKPTKISEGTPLLKNVPKNQHL